jgi:hypothetical protein
VLLAELLLAITPAARRDARGDPLVHTRRVDGDRGAEARTHHSDAVGIDLGPGGEKREGALRVLDLLEADHTSTNALALAAAAHVEAERRVAELREQLRARHAATAVFAAAEPVQDQEGGPALARAARVGQVQHARERETAGGERDALFHAVLRQLYFRRTSSSGADHG